MELDQTQSAAADQFGKQSHRYGKGHILADVSDVIAALQDVGLPENANVLDVATGAGHTGLHLASLGHHVVCGDIAQPMLDRVEEAAAERGLTVKTVQHSAESLPYPDASFDLVTCRVAAHHFSDPAAFVRETARVLRTGGSFLLIDGSIEDDQPDAETWMHEVEKLRDPSHARFISPSGWEVLCANAGLEVTQATLTPFKMPDLNWYFETANTSAANRTAVLDLVQNAPQQARDQFHLGEEVGKIVWWWRRLTLVAVR